MRTGLIAIPILIGILVSPAWAATVGQAHEAEDTGRWDEAVSLWKELARNPESGAARDARWVTGHFLRVLHVTGRTEELEQEAREAGNRYPDWDVPAIYQARALEARGRPEEGAQVLEPYGAASLSGGAERARLLGVVGRWEESGAIQSRIMQAYRPGVTYPARDLLAVAEAARARGDFQGAANLYEKAYTDSAEFLEARLELATLFHDKYEHYIAADELNQAAAISPHHPDVHLVLARLSLRNTQLSQAESAARAVLEIRPHDPGARSVLAQLALIAEDPAGAVALLEDPARINPAHKQVHSLLAAAAYLEGDSTRFREGVEQILDQDPRYLDVYLRLARVLEINRRNEEAFALYRQVLSRDPDHPGALISMGLLHMREGQEAEARGYLETGLEGDPFNKRAYNQLLLLDKMDTFSHYPTEHFEFRLEAESDSFLVGLLAKRMEAIYQELVPRHEWKPKTTTIVEVFPDHEWFSARVTGLPWIGGIPAVCFGDVIATDSPRTLSGRTNWEDILRHEFGHVLALGMTDKKVPFWFTEGLSVHLEKFPRGYGWDENLVAAYVDGELVSVDSLTIAFTRPRSMHQRMLAYHEAGLIVTDLVERKGWDAIPELLLEFGRGEQLATAIPRVTGESYAEFREAAHRMLREEANGLAVWPRPGRSRLAHLSEAASERKDDAEFLRLYAITQYQAGQAEEAAETAKRLQEAVGVNAFSSGMLGLIDRDADRPTARSHLERAVELESRDLPVYAALAGMELANRDTAAVIDLHARSLSVYPYQTEVRWERARLLARTGQTDEARDEYGTLLQLSGSAGEAALELARLELGAGRGESMVRALDYATGILPMEADTEALRGQAYLLLDRDREAYDLFLKARKLDLKSVESMVGMAGYYLKQGDYEEAAYFAELALKYDPDHPRARRILAQARAG